MKEDAPTVGEAREPERDNIRKLEPKSRSGCKSEEEAHVLDPEAHYWAGDTNT